VLVVGERGSGKTSLVNCAIQTTLSGLEVVRSEFAERFTTPEQLQQFLSGILGVPPGDIETGLQTKRRVLILEELERTFLRHAQDYAAIRALLTLISRTSRQTLWIVSTNYFCFRLLNAGLRMDPHFSHRINAMAVDPGSLREAILMRHGLSGLRLRFAPPPDALSYADRLRTATGGRPDYENDFFDALYRECGGVFRAGFALWLRYIDTPGIDSMSAHQRPSSSRPITIGIDSIGTASMDFPAY
jgi:hypothetical protein